MKLAIHELPRQICKMANLLSFMTGEIGKPASLTCKKYNEFPGGSIVDYKQ